MTARYLATGQRRTNVKIISKVNQGSCGNYYDIYHDNYHDNKYTLKIILTLIGTTKRYH